MRSKTINGHVRADSDIEKALSERRISLLTTILFPFLMVVILACFVFIVIILVGIFAG